MNSRIWSSFIILTLSLGVLLIILFYPDFTYALGHVWGSLGSASAFAVLSFYINRVKVTRLKSSLVFNRILRYSIYIGVITVANLLPDYLSLLTTIIGLFMVKLSILMQNYLLQRESRGKKSAK
jgi:hypothetical protein